MKLLIITQVVDTEHPILGFFHRWIEEFAKRCEVVHVICLQEGVHNLPENVKVHSLGKEQGLHRLEYILNFYNLIWTTKREYDAVFVHMNQIYVILGYLLWTILGKKIGLWYAHGTVTGSLRVAVKLSDIVFTSTEQGLRIKTSKRKIVGQGIDTNLFKLVANDSSNKLKLITVGRISRSKNIETLLHACAYLSEAGVDYSFEIIGPVITDEETAYLKELHDLSNELKIDQNIRWIGSVTQSDLPSYLQSSDIFIHDGGTNSLDKTLLEASLCGCVVISSNPAYKALTFSVAPDLLFEPRNALALYSVIEVNNRDALVTAKHSSELIREGLCKQYSVTSLVSGIISQY